MSGTASCQLNLYSPALRVNPFPIYAEIQRDFPVCRLEPHNFWLVSTYDDATFVLKNSDMFSSVNNSRIVRPDLTTAEHQYIPDFPMVFDDPPRHTQIRHPLNKKLLSDNISREVAFMRKTADSLMRSIRENEPVDFFADFIRPYLGRVVCHFNGFHELEYFSEIHDFMTTVELPPPETPDQDYFDAVERVERRKSELVQRLLVSQLKTPRHYLIHELLREMDDGILSREQFARLFELLSLVGFQAPRHFLCLVMIQLAHNPGMLARLARSPEKIPLFVEEVLRFNSSLHFNFRTASRDVTLSGITIPQGASVVVNAAAANRDPAYFSNPDIFDMERKSGRKHIAFGYGVHNCFGAALARTLAKVMIESAVDHLVEVTCPAIGQLPWFYSLIAHGVTNLPVKLVRNGGHRLRDSA